MFIGVIGLSFTNKILTEFNACNFIDTNNNRYVCMPLINPIEFFTFAYSKKQQSKSKGIWQPTKQSTFTN